LTMPRNETIYSETGLAADDVGDWISIDPEGREKKSQFIVQGYYENATGTLDGTVSIDLTIDKTLAGTKDLFDTSKSEPINAAAGAFTFNMENFKSFTHYRLRYTANNVTSVDIVAYGTSKVV